MSNPSGVQPIEYNLVVKMHSTEEVTSGGIILPDSTKDKEKWAQEKVTIVAMSPLAFDYDEKAPKPQVGQTVMMAKYAGSNFKGRDGEDYTLIKDKDVTAIIEA